MTHLGTTAGSLRGVTISPELHFQGALGCFLFLNLDGGFCFYWYFRNLTWPLSSSPVPSTLAPCESSAVPGGGGGGCQPPRELPSPCLAPWLIEPVVDRRHPDREALNVNCTCGPGVHPVHPAVPFAPLSPPSSVPSHRAGRIECPFCFLRPCFLFHCVWASRVSPYSAGTLGDSWPLGPPAPHPALPPCGHRAGAGTGGTAAGPQMCRCLWRPQALLESVSLSVSLRPMVDRGKLSLIGVRMARPS